MKKQHLVQISSSRGTPLNWMLRYQDSSSSCKAFKAHTHKSFMSVPASLCTIYITHSHDFVCSYILELHVLGLCLGNDIHM